MRKYTVYITVGTSYKVTSKDSDQRGYPDSLMSMFTRCSIVALVLEHNADALDNHFYNYPKIWTAHNTYLKFE